MASKTTVRRRSSLCRTAGVAAAVASAVAGGIGPDTLVLVLPLFASTARKDVGDLKNMDMRAEERVEDVGENAEPAVGDS